MTQRSRDCHVQGQISEEKREQEKGIRGGRERQAPHANLLGKVGEIYGVRASRCAAAPFPHKTLGTSRACPLVRRGAGGEVRFAGEASPQGRASCPPPRPSSSFGGNFLREAPPPSPRKPVRARARATRVPGAPGGGGARRRGGALGGRGPRRWRPWGRGLRPAPLSRRAGWALPLPPPRPGSSEGAGCVWGGNESRTCQGLTRRRKVVP